jgi:hypothetical protein
VSYELSHPFQHLFLVYDEEKNDFKGKRVISFELKDRVSCQLNQFDLASAGEKNVSLGRLSPHHQHATRGKSEDLPLFEEISLVSCIQFYFLFLVRSDPCF